MSDPFNGRSEISAADYLAVVGRNDAPMPATIAVAAQDARNDNDAWRHSEKHFRQRVVDLARSRGWLVGWVWDSRRSPEGFPDLVLLRGGRQVVAELKVGAGRLSVAQARWLVAFRAAGAETFVWTPEDMASLEEVLA